MIRDGLRRGWAMGLMLIAAETAWAQPPAAGASLIASPERGWPQFRGPRRDGVGDEKGLLPRWPEGGPRVLWTAKGAGRGFSSPIIAEGRIYVTGDFNEELRIVAYDTEGKPLWQTRNGDAWLNQYPGARASVTFSGGKLYHLNAHGRLASLDASSGRELWALNVLERFRGENITWGLSECLLVDDRSVFVTVGGRDALMVALDKGTGEVRWRCAASTDAETSATPAGAGYAAPILVRFGERRLILTCSSRALVCVDADRGELQWERPRPTAYSVLAMSPVLAGDTVFMSAPFGPPGALYRLIAAKSPGGKIGVEDVWTTRLDTAQGGVVAAEGRLYGSFYPRRGGWAALDARTGDVLFESSEIVKGSAVHADRRLYLLSEDGWMLLMDVTGERFDEQGRFRLATARDRDAWAHPVIFDGRLYLRYHDTITCYDLRGT